jgi:excisionase family DNA binding protein
MARRKQPPDDDRTPYLTVPQAAEYTGIDKTALYRAIRKGEIPVLRVGRAIRIPRRAFDDMTRAAAAG